MVANKDVTRLIKKHDLTNIAILLAIALGIGVYLIATTVLIAKDGVFYIERAQKLPIDLVGIIKTHPPGYPFLIFAAHRFVSLFSSNGSSVQAWIYSAQGVTLLCRLLALVPLYFIGKFLVGPKNSFWGILILIILPYPAKFGCDVLREWPYVLFLATGFLLLLWASKYGKWWAFGLVGLSAGLGYLIRPTCVQLVVYGFIWLMLGVFWSAQRNLTKWKLLAALVLLLIGFAVPILPCIKCTGQIINPRVKHIMESFSFNTLPDKTDAPKVNAISLNYNTAEIVPSDVLKALGEIFKTVGENLMWFFMLALVMGVYYHFRGHAEHEERFLIITFALVNVTMIVLRYCYIQPTVSKRWSVPLITFTIFYIPDGLQVMGNWFESKFSINKPKDSASKEKKLSWFLLLLLTGICICMPKLFRPVRIEKQGYRETAKWLRENTAPTDIVAVPDKRISFYAERKGLELGKTVPKEARYVVKIIKNEDEELNLGGTVKEEYSVWVDERKKNEKLVIYKVL